MLLETKSLVAGYDRREVLKGIDVCVGKGEVVALLGHNGAGKSTLLKALFGILPTWGGELFFEGQRLEHQQPSDMLNRGIVFIPQDERVFGDLTVRENLEIARMVHDTRSLEVRMLEVLKMFPVLKERMSAKARTLSTGEQQELALARGFLFDMRLLLLDEPSLGLSPQLVSRTFERISHAAKTQGISVLIAEQKVRQVLTISQKAYVLRNGEVVFGGPSIELSDEKRLRDTYL